MADFKTVTRILEFYGPEEWIEATFAQSRIPIQGVKQFQNGSYIKGGVIMWQPDINTERQADDSNSQPGNPVNGSEMSKALEQVRTVIFKRPGE